jgi:hypothetical protein
LAFAIIDEERCASATIADFTTLQETVGSATTQFRAEDLFLGLFKQNTASAERMMSEHVEALLENVVPNSGATRLFIRMGRAIAAPYLCGKNSGDPQNQVRSAFRGLAIMTLWRRYLQRRGVSLQAGSSAAAKPANRGHFLTPQCYNTLKLLAYGIVNWWLSVYLTRDNRDWSAHCLERASSAPVEKIFSLAEGKDPRLPSNWIIPGLDVIVRRLETLQSESDAHERLYEESGGTMLGGQSKKVHRRSSVLESKNRENIPYAFPATYEEFRKELLRQKELGIQDASSDYEQCVPAAIDDIKAAGDYNNITLLDFDHRIPDWRMFQGERLSELPASYNAWCATLSFAPPHIPSQTERKRTTDLERDIVFEMADREQAELERLEHEEMARCLDSSAEPPAAILCAKTSDESSEDGDTERKKASDDAEEEEEMIRQLIVKRSRTRLQDAIDSARVAPRPIVDIDADKRYIWPWLLNHPVRDELSEKLSLMTAVKVGNGETEKVSNDRGRRFNKRNCLPDYHVPKPDDDLIQGRVYVFNTGSSRRAPSESIVGRLILLTLSGYTQRSAASTSGAILMFDPYTWIDRDARTVNVKPGCRITGVRASRVDREVKLIGHVSSGFFTVTEMSDDTQTIEGGMQSVSAPSAAAEGSSSVSSLIEATVFSKIVDRHLSGAGYDYSYSVIMTDKAGVERKVEYSRDQIIEIGQIDAVTAFDKLKDRSNTIRGHREPLPRAAKISVVREEYSKSPMTIHPYLKADTPVWLRSQVHITVFTFLLSVADVIVVAGRTSTILSFR